MGYAAASSAYAAAPAATTFPAIATVGLTSVDSGRGLGSESSKVQPSSVPKCLQHQRYRRGTQILARSQSQQGVNGVGGGTTSYVQPDELRPRSQNHRSNAQTALRPQSQRGGGMGGGATESTTARKCTWCSLPSLREGASAAMLWRKLARAGCFGMLARAGCFGMRAVEDRRAAVES